MKTPLVEWQLATAQNPELKPDPISESQEIRLSTSAPTPSHLQAGQHHRVTSFHPLRAALYSNAGVKCSRKTTGLIALPFIPWTALPRCGMRMVLILAPIARNGVANSQNSGTLDKNYIVTEIGRMSWRRPEHVNSLHSL